MFWGCAALGLTLASVALYVQFGQALPLPIAGAAIFFFGGLVLAVLFWLRGLSLGSGWLALAVLLLAGAGWYGMLSPRQDRAWAFDTARLVKAERAGDLIRLRDIRDFDWTTPETATPRWIAREVDLNRLRSVDMLTSVWSSPHIAHLLVSFGFEGEDPVVFSAEIRREEGEAFSTIGGFFRQFELALIGATERDIVRLRSHLRGEEVALYPIELSPAQRRQLFLAYVGLAEQLAERPRFYNTITANCTTVVWRLARMLDPGLSPDVSLLLPGHLPAYLERLGYLGGTGDLAQKQAAARLSPTRIDQHLAAGLSFSEALRAK